LALPPPLASRSAFASNANVFVKIGDVEYFPVRDPPAGRTGFASSAWRLDLK
jgi:hypothetical protein